MRISESDNIKDNIYEPESIGTIKDYIFHIGYDVLLNKHQPHLLKRINAYVKCEYIGSLEYETGNVVSKKIEILYLKEWKDHTSYIDSIIYFYDKYQNTRDNKDKNKACRLMSEYLTFTWNHRNDVWRIVSVDNIKIENVCE